MKYSLFIFLCFWIFTCANKNQAAASHEFVVTDSLVNEQSHKIIKVPEKKDEKMEADKLHFQLDTDTSGQSKILIHLSDTVSLLTISAYNLMGESKEAVRQNTLDPGFYEFDLPKNNTESLKYWQVSMEGEKVISFIR